MTLLDLIEEAATGDIESFLDLSGKRRGLLITEHEEAQLESIFAALADLMAAAS